MKPKKMLFLSSLLLFTLVLTGCGRDDDSKPKSQEKTPSESQVQEKAQEENKEEKQVQENFEGDISDLLEKTDAMKCEFFNEQEDSRVEGVAYASDGKVRQEIYSTQGGRESETEIVIKDKTVYTWGSTQQGKGVKMDLSTFKEKTKKDEGEKQDKPQKQATQNFEYDCSAWTEDSSKFELPKDIDFVDMSGLMQEAQEVQNMTEEVDSGSTPDMDNLEEKADDMEDKADKIEDKVQQFTE